MSLAENLSSVRARIDAACAAAHRPHGSVQLLAVSKKVVADRLAEAADHGQQAFGESYVQEALPKLDALAPRALHWHFIGPVQSNKTADIAARFDWVHGVDRLKVAERLSAQRPITLPPLNICIQVNVSGETSKSGCTPEALPALAAAIVNLPRLRLRGLMCLPAPSAQLEDPRAPFRQLRLLQEALRTQGLALDTLSMGMSDDLEHAIAEGSTLVRIGSAIFGARLAGQSPPDTAS